MKIAQYFIDRPITAAVLSILLVIAGLIALPLLPISEYPQVVPPTVVVQANYPGASPKTIAQTVATPLETQINGVEGMLYTSSQSTADGLMKLTVTFALGTDPNQDQQLVQNRVTQALPQLPTEVQRLGVTTQKASPNLSIVVHLVSPDHRYNMLYLANYARLHVKDELKRLPGAGQVQVFGAGEYAMRVWLNPQKLASHNLTTGDVVNAIQEQNVQVAAGSLNAEPARSNAAFQLSVHTQGRLKTAADFRQIIVHRYPDGAVVHLGDIAKVGLGADQYSLRSMLDNQPAAAIVIFQRPGSNALDLSKQVRATMARLQKGFPQGVDYHIEYDTTVFTRSSIHAVIETLLEALGLVVLVVILFLQTWRAAIIPLVAIPVSLIGTLAVMLVAGFTLNTLSLFGLVLAIGIVVDDSIVVVENVERNIALGLAPRDATRQAMKEVSGPIIATALVLCAVFIPTAFISGLTGQFYRQFAMTIAISTVLSAFNSLTLSPTLAAVLLKPHDAPRDRFGRWMALGLGWLFRPFNRFFEHSSNRYVGGVHWLLGRSPAALVVYAGLLGLAVLMFMRVPTGFVPQQDKGYLVAFARLPAAASLNRTEDVVQRMSSIAMQQPGVAHAIAFPGMSINGFTSASNAGVIFVTLKPFADRAKSSLSAGAITAALNAKFGAIQGAYIAVFPPPPIQGLGTIGGFRMQVEDRDSSGFDALYQQTHKLVVAGRHTPGLAGLFSTFRVNVPQVKVNVDRAKAKAEGVDLNDVYQTMQAYLGSLYVNQFNRFGRTWHVDVSAEPQFRSSPSDIGALKTRNASGQLVPLDSFVNVQRTNGPNSVMHYNGYPTAAINGGPAQGYSSGQAQARMERLAHTTLPEGMGFQWTDLTYQQILAGNTTIYVFPLCVLFVFLLLSALYESWTLPLAVILIVPMGLLSAIAGLWLTHGDNNIFTQIGLIVLIGLACKNAILIVEFAKDRQRDGVELLPAVLEAARLRLRPILMTSIAFIMGVVPLVVAKGAGAEMLNAMGIAVFFGMIGVSAFGLIFTPVFYLVIRGLVERRRARRQAVALKPFPDGSSP